MKESKQERETILRLGNKPGRVTGPPKMFKCLLRCTHDQKLRPLSTVLCFPIPSVQMIENKYKTGEQEGLTRVFKQQVRLGKDDREKGEQVKNVCKKFIQVMILSFEQHRKILESVLREGSMPDSENMIDHCHYKWKCRVRHRASVTIE